MADTPLTLNDLLTINDQRLTDYEMSEVLNSSPVIAALPAVEASDNTNHKYLKQTGAPSAGFRDPNTGLDKSPDTDVIKDIALKILDCSWDVDLALADKYNKGGRLAYAGRRTLRAIRQALFVAEKQLWYGTGNDASGFNGLVNETHLDALADANVISVGGSAANATTSVWVFRAHAEEGLAFVGDKRGVMAEDPQVIQKLDGSGKQYPALYVAAEGWAAIQPGTIYSAVRLVNIDDANTLNDDWLYEAMSLFPGDAPATHIAMNRRALKQLRQSRTATNVVGAPAPVPTEVEGRPILVTDSILDTEAVVA